MQWAERAEDPGDSKGKDLTAGLDDWKLTADPLMGLFEHMVEISSI